MKRLLILFTLLACLLAMALPSLPSLAQTPEPTAAATPEPTPSDAAPTETAPTAEATPADAIVIDTGDGGSVTIPVDETPEPDNRVSLTIIEVILLIVGGMVTGGASVGTLAYFIMKDPARIALMEKLADSVPPETAAKIVGVIDVFTPILTLAKEMFDRVPYADKNAIEAGVAQAFTAERQRERDTRNAKAENERLEAERLREGGNSSSRPINVMPPAPNGPVMG